MFDRGVAAHPGRPLAAKTRLHPTDQRTRQVVRPCRYTPVHQCAGRAIATLTTLTGCSLRHSSLLELLAALAGRVAPVASAGASARGLAAEAFAEAGLVAGALATGGVPLGPAWRAASCAFHSSAVASIL